MKSRGGGERAERRIGRLGRGGRDDDRLARYRARRSMGKSPEGLRQGGARARGAKRRAPELPIGLPGSGRQLLSFHRIAS